VITDGSKGAAAAVEERDTQHMLDSVHVSDNIKEKSKGKGDECKSLYLSAFHAKNATELHAAKAKYPPELARYLGKKKGADKNLYKSCIPGIGDDSTSNAAESINNRLKSIRGMSSLVALEWVMSKLVSKFHRDSREAGNYDADKFLWPPQSLLPMTQTEMAAIRILPAHIVEIGESGEQIYGIH